MKTPDLSKSVMKSVIRFEKKRTSTWFVQFALILAALVLIAIGCMILAINILSQMQIWSMTELLNQDPEIIVSYWQDTLWVMWEQAPQEIILFVFFVTLATGGLWVVTIKKRRILRQKQRQLEKYR